MNETVSVEIVYASRHRQLSARRDLPAPATVADALETVAAEGALAGLDLASVAVGIWGRVVADRHHVLRDGDRIEIYRALDADPKDARRKRSADTAQRKRGAS